MPLCAHASKKFFAVCAHVSEVLLLCVRKPAQA
jgi:hypothetical protein